MSRKEEYFRQELKEITSLIILGLLVFGFLIYAGFSLTAFEQSFQEGRPLEFGDKLVFILVYFILFPLAFFGLPILKIRELLLTDRNEHPANQSKPELFNVAIINDPQQDGLLYNLFDYIGLKGNKNPMRWTLSFWRFIIVGIIFFGFIGVLQSIFKFQFVGIPQQILFQITPATEIFFSAEPPAFIETLSILFIFCVLLSVCGYVSSKFKLGKGGYYSLGILACVITGFLFMGFHNITYENDEASLIQTFVFGFVGSLITLLLGRFEWWYIWHFSNNAFAQARETFSSRSEDIVFVTIITLVILLISWISLEVLLYKRRNPYSSEELLVPR